MAMIKSYEGGGGFIIRALTEGTDGAPALGEIVLHCIGLPTGWIGIESTSFDPDAVPPVISFVHNRTCDVTMLNFINKYSPGINPLADSEDAYEEYKTEDGYKFADTGGGGGNTPKVAVVYFGPSGVAGTATGGKKGGKRIMIAGIGKVTKTGQIDTGHRKLNKNTTEVEFETPTGELVINIAEWIAKVPADEGQANFNALVNGGDATLQLDANSKYCMKLVDAKAVEE